MPAIRKRATLMDGLSPRLGATVSEDDDCKLGDL